MKFRFIGKPTILVDTLTTDKVYNILQFQQTGHTLLVYLVDDNKNLLVIPYGSLNKFNDNWSYQDND